MKDNICITVNNFPGLGGASMVIHEYWRVLNEKYSVHFLTNPLQGYKKDYNIHRLFKFYLSSHVFPICFIYVVVGFFKLLMLHRNHKFKVIIPQEGSFTALYSAIFGKLTGVRVILMDYGHSINVCNDEFWKGEGIKSHPLYKLHPFVYKLHTFLYRKFAFFAIKIAVKLVDDVMIVGVDLDELYRNVLNVPDTKIRYYELGVDEKRFSPISEEEIRNTRKKFNITNDEVVVSWAGRLSHEKGIEYLLIALEKRLNEQKGVRILIAGKGDMEKIISDFIKNNSFQDRIKLVGLLTPEEMPMFLGVSDIFLYTATQGGTMSSGVLQAMSCECAVIATNHPRSHGKLLNGRNGIVIPTEDSDAIYKSIKYLVENPLEMQKMKKKGRKYILEHHSFSALEKYLDFI